ncbi:hypothetical protein K432DRAFT_429349 [Lepidopterella palustris CBS 459.81]|uniref:Fungal N-terminal domain-containing protein n=1 Tax=Lepidopterella palustris CBS 459.81 TaxID=1314670 RepID=A0A8E2JAP2_9PEZI|nr:hypothetical protein K432DRAFT_429349 [Lepidopterella palustris CBS 459.81]
MIDPISVSVSVITLIGAAHKLSSAISYLRKTGYVPARVDVLKNEVTDLEVVLKQVAGAIQQNNLDGQDEAFNATLADAKQKLAEVSSTVERIGNALERNKSKFIKRNAISAKEMANLETLLIDVRALKKSFGLMLGFSASVDLQRIKLELHSISYLTKESGQLQMGRHEAVSEEIQDTYSAMTTRLDRNYYEFDERMKGIERLLLLEG